jgi:UDP-3-O-[3-hydroxymyristoyl] glucosamine N-acyltransferase
MAYRKTRSGGWLVPPGRAVGRGLVIPRESWIGDNVSIARGCVIGAGSRIGNNVTLAPNVTIGPDCTIGDNLVAGPDCEIGDRCVIGPGLTYGPRSRLGRHVTIHAHHSEPMDWQQMPKSWTVRDREKAERRAKRQQKQRLKAELDDPYKLEPSQRMDLPPTHGEGKTFPDGSRFPVGTTFGPNCAFGDNCVFGHGCVIDHGFVIGENAKFGQRCVLGRGRVGRGAKVGDKVVTHAATWFEGGCDYYTGGAPRRRFSRTS